MEYDHLNSSNPICPHEDHYFFNFYWYIYSTVFGGYIFVLVLLFMKILMIKPGPDRIPYYPTIHLVTISTTAVGIASTRNWGGICVDIFGAATPAAILGEWMACSPLLLFITISTADKNEFSIEDIMLLVTFWLPFVLFYIFHIQQPYWLSCLWFMLGVLTITINFWLLLRACNKKCTLLDVTGDSDFQQLSGNLAKRINLVIAHSCIIPLFPLWYMIVVFGGVDRATTISIFQVLTFFSKATFSVIVTDTHIQLLSPAIRALIEERRANEARRAFLRYIFHEVRTPLNSLTMGIDILERSDHLDDSELDSLVMMKDASTFMAETLNDVLSMQKIEEGKLELELQPFSLCQTISKVVSTFKGALRSKNLKIVLDTQSNFPATVIGDRFRIEHVLSNLLSNAIKFSAINATVRIAVSFKERKSTDKSRVFADVTVSCMDEGPGISQADQGKLFTNFMQIQPGANQSGQGTGLGLSLCKQIVTLHGGTIGYKCRQGCGSEFYINIPFEVALDEDTVIDNEALMIKTETADKLVTTKSSTLNASTRSTIVPPLSVRESSYLAKAKQEVDDEFGNQNSIDATRAVRHPQVPQTRAYRALVVDDTDSNRKMLTMLLRKEGVAAASVEDGDVAVETVVSDPDRYRLILMDNFMSRMNGAEATREIRAAGYKYIIAGVTGDVLEEDVSRFLTAGADIVLPKPLKVASLVMLLSHMDVHGGESRPGMKLTQSAGAMVWVAENTSHR